MKNLLIRSKQGFEAQKTDTIANRLAARWRSLLLLVITLFVLTVSVWPVSAAIELLDFTATSSANDLLLTWSTNAEYDLSRFEVLCKAEAEPDSLYHTIGVRPAQGSPQQGANYYFLVDGLQPGQRYCFRLREVTTNGEPGEVFDLCGYGLGITPTPVLTTTFSFTSTPTVTFTPFITGAAPFLGTPTLTPITVLPNNGLLTPSTLPTQTFFTPTPTIFFTSPLPTPIVTPVSPAGVITNTTPIIPQPSFSPVPPITPTLPGGAGPLPIVTPVPPLTATATLTPGVPVLPTVVVPPSNGADANNNLPESSAGAGDDAVAQAAVTPGAAYVVVTATPTLAAIALVSTLTPLPTVTPQSNLNLASVVQPSTQNVAILLLCFTFFGASGLGILGLLTSLLYMRSRTAGDRVANRRRL
ncbi:MAG: fibronectin type III domain-containing protein [Chloroflexota bacterium]|nr:fibronectin type III domain-containing protein [Chloroflexota bacterium]